MRRMLLTALAALTFCLILNDHADAQRGGRGFGGGGMRAGGFGGGGMRAGGFGGGGMRVGGFGGAGFRGGGFGGYRAVGIGAGGARWAGGVTRAGWVGGRPVWGGARPGWGRWAGYRPGWGYRNRYPLYGIGAGLGLATAAYYGGYGGYGGYYPYNYGYYDAGYGDCAPVRQSIWNGYRYRVVWVNPCEYY